MSEEQTAKIKEILQFVNQNLGLQSLLYDLDLLPEQCADGSLDQKRMLILSSLVKDGYISFAQ